MDWPLAAIIISIFVTTAASFTSIFINKKKAEHPENFSLNQKFRETTIKSLASIQTYQKTLFYSFEKLEKRFDNYITNKKL